MITATVDMSGFHKGMGALLNRAKISAPRVIEKETGELEKTLVRLSPPANLAKSRARLERRIESTFEALGQNISFNSMKGNQHSKAFPGVIWYAVDEAFLRGVGERNDMRKADDRQLRAVYLRTSLEKRGARQIFPFNPPRKKQRIKIKQRVITDDKKRAALVRHMQGNLGRLRAGWLVASHRGPIRLTGSNMPPAWVTRHLNGAQGDFVNGLANKDAPHFTIINRAKGIGQPQVNSIVRRAVAIRAKAMQANALLFAQGKKKLSDY